MIGMSEFFVDAVPPSVLTANFGQETSTFHLVGSLARSPWTPIIVLRRCCDLTLIGLAATLTRKIGNGRSLYRYPMPFIHFVP